MKSFTFKWRMPFFTSLIVFFGFPITGFAELDRSQTEITVDVPKILITPNFYDFGTLTVGQTRTLQVAIKNRGEGTLSLLQLGDINSSSEAYVLSEHCTNQSLAPNKLCRLNVTFQPQSDGIQNATLSIQSNDPAKPVITMSLKGKAILLIPKMVVSSMADYQFGAIDVNRTQDLWIRIANTGNGPLQIGEILPSTDDFFLKSPSCANQIVAPDNECKMRVTFKPQSNGIRKATLSIASNDPDTPLLKVSLKGEGIALTHKISVLSKTLDFGLQPIDSTTTEDFRITSKGTGNLQLGLIQVSSTDFRLDTTTCANKTMLPGRDCFVPVTFRPQSGGAKNAILSIPSDDPEIPILKVSLTGEGIVLMPNIAVNSTDYDFGDLSVGNTKSLYFEIENRGDGDLKIGQLKLASQAAFSLSHDNCTNSNLAAYQACTVLMIFQPKSGGTKTASFSILSNDPDQASVTVSLKGKAFASPKMVLNQTTFQFGIVKVGSTSAASMFIIQNTGNDDLQIGAITILGEYDLMQSCANKTLSPQGQCTLIVAFKPKSEGVLPGSLSIASNDPDIPNLRVSLEGEGRDLMSPAIEITPTAIQFEDIQYGKTSAVQTITVKNVGKGPLSIKGLGFTEGHRYDFRLQEDSCAYQTIAPSSSCTVQLQFQPTAIGSRTVKFYLFSDDPDMPTVSISLAGNGNMPDGLACPTTPTIESVQSGPWNSPSTWDQNRLPNADDVVGIHPNHTLLAQAPFYQETWHNRIQIKGLCHHGVIRHGYQTWWYRRAGSRYRDGYGYLSLQASAFIYNYGQILGNAGYSGYYYGGQGGSVYLSTQGPFYNAPEATIRGGKGHRNQEYAGDGGHVEIYGHHTTNFGTLCAGNGSPTGQGGNLMITGNQGDPGILRNEGLLCGGEGQKGSFVSIQSRPLVMLNGGTLRTSKQGQIWIGADIILADDATQITGGQITLSGGDNAVLDLSRFAANAISASNLITVGNRGVIDFKASGNPALKAPEVKLHTDRVLLPDGKSLTDRIDTAHLIMGVAKTLRKVSLNTPAAFAAEPGSALPIPLTIVNHGPKRETYQFSVTDTAGWVLGTLPSTLRLDGLQTRTLQFKVTLPATSAENTITINAFSQDDSEIRNTVTVRVAATTEQIEEDGRQHEENDTPFDGHYTDETGHEGNTDSHEAAGDDTQGEADNQATGDIYLVSGNIRDKFKNQLPGVTVQVGEQTTLTNEQGDWQIGPLAEGDYTATASQTGYRFQAQNVSVGNQQNAIVTFKPTSLLNLKVVSQPSHPEQGENIAYKVTVSNQGLETATNLILTEVLPENTNLVSIETVNGHCDSNTLTCTLGDLAADEQTTIEIVVSNQEAEKLINTVQITANDYPADIKTTWTEIRPYLSVVVRDVADPIALTDRVQRINGINGLLILKYTIETTLNDKAPSSATEVELEITLPQGVELQAINTDYGNCDLSQRPILICSLSDLGGIDNIRQIPVHIEVRLKDAGLLLLTLAAQITSKDYPIHTDRERTEISIGDIEVDFALLLDVTASMQTEIAELLEAVKRSEEWANGELVLITFRDEVTVKALTQDINVLQTALEQLEAKGGGSCPEASIEALQVAIPHVKAGGTIFLITDASPYPDADIENVIEQLLSKGIRLNAQITGDCSIESSWN